MKVCSTVYCYGSYFFSIYVNVRCKYFGTCQITALYGIELQKSQEWAALSMGLMVSLLYTNIRYISKYPVYFIYFFFFFGYSLGKSNVHIACQWLKWKEISTDRYEILLRSNQMQMSLTRTRCIPSSSSEILFPNIFLSYFLSFAYSMPLITQWCESPNDCSCPSLEPFAELIPSDGGHLPVEMKMKEKKVERKRENDSFEELCKAALMAAWKSKMKFIRTLNLN